MVVARKHSRKRQREDGGESDDDEYGEDEDEDEDEVHFTSGPKSTNSQPSKPSPKRACY